MADVLFAIAATLLIVAWFYEHELSVLLARAERAERAAFRALNQAPEA